MISKRIVLLLTSLGLAFFVMWNVVVAASTGSPKQACISDGSCSTSLESEVTEKGFVHSVQGRHASIRFLSSLTPTVNLLSPPDGGTLDVRDVEVQFEVFDHVIGPIGTPHIHFHLDNDPIPFMMFNGDDPMLFGQQVVLFDFDVTSRATWISTDTLRFNALSNGQHTLTAHLVDGNHNIYGNPEASITIDFTVFVNPDDANPPGGIVFVKEQPNPIGLGAVNENAFDIVSDLYRIQPATPTGTLYQLTDVASTGGGVSDPEVSWDGQKILFSMRQNAEDTWHIWEMDGTGSNLQQITFDPIHEKVNDIDPEYLPDGRIIFASDRFGMIDEYRSDISTQLYTADADGQNIRLVEATPSHSLNPQVIDDGRIVFDSWDNLRVGRNIITNWHMNQDGSSGFAFYGGATPSPADRVSNAQGIERRQLSDGQMVGIFTDRLDLGGGVMGIFDNRSGDLEDLPNPVVLGPDGLYRTPHTFMTNELIYSYSTGDVVTSAQFGLYTMPWTEEIILYDDATVTTAPGPGTNLAFRSYSINLAEPGHVYIEVTGTPDDNDDSDGDDVWVIIDDVSTNLRINDNLDGDLIQGLQDTFRIDADLDTGEHIIDIATDETPTINRVRIVEGVRGDDPVLFYDDPDTNEISPIPVRPRTLPSLFPSRLNNDLSYGTFLVRDISLRGDFRQPNHDSPEGDPDFHFHLDLNKLAGLRVFQTVPNVTNAFLAGERQNDPIRVLGVVPANEYGSVSFQTQANTATAWEVIGHDGGAIVREEVWSQVRPGEIRACGGCHVPQMPYVQREIGPFPEPMDLRLRGEIYTFSDQILPIVQDACTACHTGSTPAGGLDLRGDRPSFDDLREIIPGRVPEAYVVRDGTRNSFLFQLLIGDAHGDTDHQTRIDAINAVTDHTTMLPSEELYELATWIDVGAGFLYLIDSEPVYPPTVVGVLPQPDVMNVTANSGVAIQFSDPIDRATVDSSTFSLSPVGGNPVSGTWHWGDNENFIFQPDAPLANGEYEVNLSGDIYSVKAFELGDLLATPFSSRFTVGSSDDNIPPQIVEIVPDSTSPPIGPVAVRFDEQIEPGSVTEHMLWVQATNGFFVEGRVGVSADGLEAAFTPYAPYEKGASYTMYVAEGIKDLAGNSMVAAGNGPDSIINSIVTSATFTITNSPAQQHHSLVADRAIESGPRTVAVNADGSQVLVANPGIDTISHFDGTTWDLLATYTVGDGPYDLAFSPDSAHAYVFSAGDASVHIVRLSDGAILATVPGIVSPDGLDVNNAGTRLYITDKGDAINLDPYAVYEVDVDPGSPSFGQILRSLSLTEEPEDVAVSSDDDLLYISGGRSFIVVDVDLWLEKRITNLFNTVTGEIALSPDERQAIVPITGNGILVFDLITGQVVEQLFLVDDPESAVYSPDGQFIYITEKTNGTVAILDVATLEVIRRLPSTGSTVNGLAIDPAGDKIYVTVAGDPGHLRVFHRGDLSDTTKPLVTSVEPANGTSNAPTNAPIIFSLSEQIDRLSVNDQTVYLEDGGAPLSGALTIANDNQTIYLTPATALQPNRAYSLHITTGIQDLAGNALAAEEIVSFTTAEQLTPVPIGLWAAPFVGINPQGAAVTPDGLKVLVADNYVKNLHTFDTNTWESSTLPLEARASQIAINPDGITAYVLRPENDDVVVVDLAGNVTIDIDPVAPGLQGIPVGDWPVSALYHPSAPILYVVNEDSGDVSVIDTQTLAETDRWPVNGVVPEFGLKAHGAALSPDGQQLYVTWRNSLSVLDTSDGHLVELFDGLPGRNLYGIVAVDGGNQLWIAADTNELIGFDLRIEEIVAQVVVGDTPTWLALSPDGETIFVINEADGDISLVQWRTGFVYTTRDLPALSNAMALTMDGQRLFIANSEADALLVYEFADPADQTPPTAQSITPALGTKDLALDSPITIEFDEPLDRSSVLPSTIQLVEGLDPGSSPSSNPTIYLSPDNSTVTLSPNQLWITETLYSLHLEGLTDMAGNPLEASQFSYFNTPNALDPVTITLQAETLFSDNPMGMAFAPDGNTLAVSNYEEDTVSLLDIATFAVIGTPISTGDGPRGVAFSSDGSSLYVAHDLDNSLVVIAVDSQQVQQSFFGLSDAEELTLSPDGTEAYVTGYDSGGVDRVDLVTGQVTPQLQAMVNPGRPAFAPDGMLYVPARDRLWRQNSDGSWTELIISTGGYMFDVVFSASNQYAYLSQLDNKQIQVVDLFSWQPTRSISVGKEPRQMVQSADKRILVVANARDGNVQVIDTLTYESVVVLPISGRYLASLAWDESSGELFVGSSYRRIVYRVELVYGISEPPPTLDGLIYVSSTSGGNVGGTSFADEDILGFDERTDLWHLIFDGSDVGLKSTDINAFSFLEDGTLLFSIDSTTFDVPDVGIVEDSDILRFVPTSLGMTTAGTFELYFDGSDVDLAANGEDIDAITLAPDGNIILSFLGSAKVNGTSLSVKDEDLLLFTATSLGQDTTGTWSLYFDGDDVGLADTTQEDINGAWIDDLTGNLLLTTLGVFDVTNSNGDGADAFVCALNSIGDTTECGFGPGLYFDGSNEGFGGEVIDGLSLRPNNLTTEQVWVTSTTGGTVNGLRFSDEDILGFDKALGVWYMVFDGSDMGLNSTDINAFTLLDDGTWLISLDSTTYNVQDVGTVEDVDVIRFTPVSIGADTSGSFSLYFDGSDVELTAGFVDIDAITMAADGNLIISLSNDVILNGGTLNAADEDLLLFSANSLGSDTNGTWSLYFDGSDGELHDSNDEEVNGVWLDSATGEIYLTTVGPFNVDGISGDGADVFTCVPQWLGGTTNCQFGPGLYFDGSDLGILGEILDGLTIFW